MTTPSTRDLHLNLAIYWVKPVKWNNPEISLFGFFDNNDYLYASVVSKRF